jgi:prevent-host-death family protein
MAKRAHSVAANEFSAHCLSLLEEVTATGEPLIVTQQGKPVAKLVPFERPRPLLGSIVWEKDIVSPIDEAAPRRGDGRQLRTGLPW